MSTKETDSSSIADFDGVNFEAAGNEGGEIVDELVLFVRRRSIVFIHRIVVEWEDWRRAAGWWGWSWSEEETKWVDRGEWWSLGKVVAWRARKGVGGSQPIQVCFSIVL